MRNNPRVRIAPCTMSGKIVGPEAQAMARILDPNEFSAARAALARKYWLMKLPFLWSRRNVFLELTPVVSPAA
jgi:hypothetical protein